MPGLFKDLADKAAAGKCLRAELRQLRALKRRLLALDGAGTCPCCSRMEGAPHYNGCSLFNDWAILFVVEETAKLGVQRHRL